MNKQRENVVRLAAALRKDHLHTRSQRDEGFMLKRWNRADKVRKEMDTASKELRETIDKSVSKRIRNEKIINTIILLSFIAFIITLVN